MKHRSTNRITSILARLKNSDGWTFIETLVVIAIVLVLSGTVGFLAFNYIDSAKVVTARTQIESFSLALNTYYLDTGRFPTQEQGLNALWRKPTSNPVPDRWRGPYIDKAPGLDPWNNEYVYSVPGPNGLPFGITSYGADAQVGGEGNDEDIRSWGDEDQG